MAFAGEPASPPNPGIEQSLPEVARNTGHPGGGEPHQRYTFDSLQAMRALAALLVVTLHATLLWSQTADGSRIHQWDNGNAGVDLFFIISGFVMAVSVYGRTRGEPIQKPHAASGFLLRRFVRIAPLYWLFTSLRVLKYLLQVKHIAFTHAPFLPLSVPFIVQSFLFIPARNSQGFLFPIIFVGWTLCFEMFFYLLLAITLKVRVRADRFLVPLMLTLSLVGLFYRPSWPPITTLLHGSLLLEFLAGLLLGLWIVRGRSIRTIPALIGGAVALPILLLTPFDATDSVFRGLWWGSLAFLVVLAGIALEKHLAGRWPPLLVFLGDASYSLYLAHIIIFEFLKGPLQHLHMMQPGNLSLHSKLLTTTCLVGCAVVAGSLCYVLIERPLNNALRRRLLTPRSGGTVPAE